MLTDKSLQSQDAILGTMSREVHNPAAGRSHGQSTRRKKVLAISSGGGHWVQLLRLRKAFDDCDVTFVTVSESYESQLRQAAGPGNYRFRVVPDSNQWKKMAVIKCALGVFWTLLRERPDVVISTGAAPGYFGVRFGKLLGARTIWVDSVANAEELSLSGKKIAGHADLYLTQWPHLASDQGPKFAGNVL